MYLTFKRATQSKNMQQSYAVILYHIGAFRSSSLDLKRLEVSIIMLTFGSVSKYVFINRNRLDKNIFRQNTIQRAKYESINFKR